MATYGRSINTNLNLKPFSGKGSDIRVELHGEWVTLKRLFQYLSGKSGQGIKRDIAKAGRDFALTLQKALITGLASEGKSIGASWKPHSDSYSTWLKHHPTLEEGSLLSLTGNYSRAIRNAKVKQKGYQVSLQLSRGDLLQKSHKKGISLGQFAVIHEVGSPSRNIPARKLWQPAFNSIGGERRLVQKTIGGVGKRLRKLGINISTSQTSMGIGFLEI